MYSLKIIVLNYYFLSSIIVEIHCEVNISDSLQFICNNIIWNINFCEWRDRALESNMLYIDRYPSINPSCINKLIICKCDIAMILSVYHRSVPSNIKANKGVVVPYLIICNHSLVGIKLTLTHWLIYCHSIYSSYVNNGVCDINIDTFLCHHDLLAKFKNAILNSHPFIWRKIRKE